MLFRSIEGIQFPYPGTSAPAGKTRVAWLDLNGFGQGETALVSHYNATNKDNIFLELDIVSNSGHTNDDITAGAFDIVGPIDAQASPRSRTPGSVSTT